ncbi:hypothetical protein WJX82_007299 [Trebouxia sp. C0006]
MHSETGFSQSCSLISSRPQHSRRHTPTKGCKKQPTASAKTDRDHALLRLEAQVARKKLSLTSQQLDEARRENTALHAQLVEMQASQQSLQASQEATLSKQQSAQSDVKTKLRSQLQQSQGHAAQLGSQLAAATEAASRSQTAQSAQLQQLSEQHAGVLRQLRADHEAQLEAATQHHKALLQAHTEQLEQQNQAHVQQLLVQHASELHSRAAALTAQQQQLHADAEKAASKHAVDVTQRQQLLERSNALLAAEKQKTTALKAQLKREGKEAAAQLVELQGQHQAMQKQAHASSKAWEDERRKANRSLRESKTAAEADLLKLKQSLTDAEQQQHEAVRQCEAEGHRSTVKLAQAGRSLKAARQEAAEAQQQAKEAREESGCAQAQVDQTSGQVTGLREELQALKTRLASHAALHQDAATSSLRSLEEQLDTQAQHSALLQSVLRTISNVMPATSAQQDRWQQEEEELQGADRGLVEPQEVLKQVQSYIQQVQAGQDRWHEEEEEHRQPLESLRVAQERLEGRLRQQEKAKAIAEGEIARQKGCISSMRAEASELECALHRALVEAKDAKAAQINADKVVSACRAELLQLSSSLASQHEQASMWEGRAQGLQQQLDQARLDQQLLQQDHSQVVNESAGKEERLRRLGQQVVIDESVRNELEDANGTLTKQLEQTTARALMAESAAQSLSTQLETQHDESHKSTQAEAQVADSGVQAQARGGEIRTLQQQLAQAQAELQQVQTEAAAKHSSLKARLKTAAQAAQKAQTQQQDELSQLQALRVEGLMKKSEERRSRLECDKRRLQTFVRELKSEASSWEHKCVIAQEAQTALQAEASRLQKQAAASAAASHTQTQLLEQLQAAETPLADSHGSAQKLLRELSESRAARNAKQQELEGLQTRYNCAEQQLQHLQSVADSVLAELESTRQAISASTVSLSGKSLNRGPAVARQLLPQALLVDNDENAQPNSMQQLPDSQDAKSERIRQLHVTLGALIDERDELQDTLSSSASPELARQLEDAQAELRVLRKYAGSQTSGRTSLAELDMLSFRQN